MQKVAIIGGGIGGLATAALLAKNGYSVSVFEKNEQLGGKASVFKEQSFMFDMGPSWYLMPDVFERYFSLLGKKVSDYLSLKRLTPSYQVFFKDTPHTISVADKNIYEIFEKLEPGSSAKLKEFLKTSAAHYTIAMRDFIYRNYDHLTDFFQPQLIREGLKLKILNTMQQYVSSFFKSPELQKLLQYQLVFLGNSPYNAPAIYNIMTHVDFDMGVYYPLGGMTEIIQALVKLGTELGVTYHCNSSATEIITTKGKTTGIRTPAGIFTADIVISNADIAHTEETLLKNKADRSFSKKYWDKRTLAPSGFIMYLGHKGKLPQLDHHNLIFSKDWPKNFAEIYDKPQWPTDPSLYMCMPSKYDASVAPQGHENIFIFVPIPSRITDTPEIRATYAQKILKTISSVCNIPDLEKDLVFQRTFSLKDFTERYNCLGGSSLGLAHTLMQTAIFRPNNISKKIKNLYYVGANTNPGIGVPMCLISAELAVKRIINS